MSIDAGARQLTFETGETVVLDNDMLLEGLETGQVLRAISEHGTVNASSVSILENRSVEDPFQEPVPEILE